MKVLLCHNFYQQPGGEQVAVLASKSLLEEKGHEVIFYTEDNRDIERYTTLQKIAFFPRTVFSRHTYQNLLRLATQEKPDVAHVHNVFPLMSPAVYSALKKAGVPIVQTVHNYRLMCINALFLAGGRICERCKTGKFFSGVRLKCYRDSYLLSGAYALSIGSHRRRGTFDKIDRFIALSDFMAQKLTESGLTSRSKISILGNFFPGTLPDYGDPDLQDPYIVYVGRLSHEKGILTLLQAMRDLKRLRLKVMGAGPLLDDMEPYIRDHRLQNVDMLGFVDGEEKYRLLRNALCCVLPSECYEAFPFVVLESAAVGTPVIASRIGSLATLISEGQTGLLFTPGDGCDLRVKLEHVIAEPEMAMHMGRRARRWVESEYTADTHHEELMKIYQQVLR